MFTPSMIPNKDIFVWPNRGKTAKKDTDIFFSLMKVWAKEKKKT